MKILTVNNKKEAKFLKRQTSAVDLKSLTRDQIRKLIREMRALMKKADGVGLSANQIGVDRRLFVAQIPAADGSGNKFYAVINPEILKRSKEVVILEEGCLSIPDTFGAVARSEKITIAGFDASGKKVKIKAWGLLARVFQHEVDHLSGILFTDKAKDIKKILLSPQGKHV